MQQQNFTEPKHGCGFWPSMEGTGGEEKALSEGPKASESGWTMYLDQSIHECSGYTKSLIEFEEEEARNGKNGKVWFHQKDEEDSSSMASDASSGPAQPLEAVTPKEFYNKVGCDGLKLSDLDVADLRKPKRRRLESDEQKDLDLLEDTASSPVCSFKSGLTENEAQIKYFLDFSKVLCDSHEQADAVNKRLDLLQSILPETPICREETLGAAIKYISSLEQRIKTFEGKDKSKDSHVVQAARENMEGESGILRERGLCLVPISSLCNTI